MGLFPAFVDELSNDVSKASPVGHGDHRKPGHFTVAWGDFGSGACM